MKTLIVYASKYGCTKDCANYLKAKLPDGAELADINGSMQIELNEFETVIIGGPVYAGKVPKKLRVFCQENLDTLTKKRVGIFLCCTLFQQADEFFAGSFPGQLLDRAVTKKVFGSEARLEKMAFFDKAIMKIFTKGDYSRFKVSTESMDEFVREITV